MDKLNIERKDRNDSNTDNQSIILLISCGIFIGVLSANYFPITGGFLMQFAQPWSDARMSLIPAHVVIFGVIGAMIGLFIRKNNK